MTSKQKKVIWIVVGIIVVLIALSIASMSFWVNT